MPTENLKLNRPAAANLFARAAHRLARPDRPHTVPVAEMASPFPSSTTPPIDREDVADAAEIARLLALPFPAFAQAVAGLLQCLGYTDVAAMKAMHGRGKGRNAHGGYDLRMYLPTRLTRGLVIAQVKQYREAVPRSFVDELRGAMLRLGARQGLLVTTSTFSASAIEAAQAAQYAAPVRLMDGQELARLIRTHPQGLKSPAVHTAPIRPSIAPPSASAARPARGERADGKQPTFLDGQSLPPDSTVSSKGVLPTPENVTLTLRLDICVAPAVSDSGSDKQERRRT